MVLLIGRGDPLKTRSAYGLLGEALRQRLDIRSDQDVAEQRTRLRERIAAALPADEVLRVTVFMGELCGVPFPDEESPQLRAARQDPRIVSDQVEQAWLDGLRIFHSSDPLLLILEDLHWVQISNVFWREQYQEILRLAPEALSVLPPGSKLWCQVFIGFLPALGFLQQTALLEKVRAQFLAVMPHGDALACYLNALSFMSSVACHTGQRALAESLSTRLVEVSAALTPQDRDAWAYVYIEEAFRNNLIVHRPYTGMTAFKNALDATCDSGNRKLHAGLSAQYCKVMFELRQVDAALTAGRTSLFLIQQVNEELMMSFAQLYLARALASTRQERDLHEAEQLCNAVLRSKTPMWPGQAYGVLAQIAFHRGDLTLAEFQTRLSCEALTPFPPYRAEVWALRSRILSAQGHEAESLRVCEEALREQQALGLESYGLIDLYVALAEAQARAGQHAEHKQTLARALPILQSRAADIPDPAMRATYLSEVPENARLLQLVALEVT